MNVTLILIRRARLAPHGDNEAHRNRSMIGKHIGTRMPLAKLFQLSLQVDGVPAPRGRETPVVSSQSAVQRTDRTWVRTGST
jgi:hypothetical protein